MVPYAGYDPDARPFDDIVLKFSQYHTKRKHSLSMFKAGKDTADIAKAFGVHERTVLRWITEERSARLGRPNPYQQEKN